MRESKQKVIFFPASQFQTAGKERRKRERERETVHFLFLKKERKKNPELYTSLGWGWGRERECYWATPAKNTTPRDTALCVCVGPKKIKKRYTWLQMKFGTGIKTTPSPPQTHTRLPPLTYKQGEKLNPSRVTGGFWREDGSQPTGPPKGGGEGEEATVHAIGDHNPLPA